MNPSSSSSFSSSSATTTSSFRHLREKQQFSRLLYGNPVCLLTTGKRPALGYHYANAMTISWLTPVDNQGNIFLSINTKRQTAERLMKEFSTKTIDETNNPRKESHSSETTKTYFVLNVPTAGQEDMVLRIGGCSGRDVDKFAVEPGQYHELASQGTATEGVDNQLEEEKDQLPMRSFTLCRPGWTTYCSDETTTNASSTLQPISPPTASSTSPISPTEKEEHGHRKASKKKKKLPADDFYCGGGDGCCGDLVAITECIAHIVCR